MNSSIVFAIVICIALALGGCRIGDLSTFALQNNSGWPIEGKIVDSIPAVNVYADNALTVASGGGVAMRTRNLTDGVFSMQLTLKAGNSLTVQTRTTPYSDSVQQEPGITIHIRSNAVTVEPVSPRVSVPVDIKTDEPFIVQIVDDGHWIDVTVACIHVGRFPTSQPTTQWMILRSKDLASCTIVDPTFRPLFTQE